MKTLIAIVSCMGNQKRRDLVRSSWLKDFQENDVDVVFFIGDRRDGVQYIQQVDSDVHTMLCEVEDGRMGLPAKTRSIMRYAVEKGYQRVCKVDDDVYVVPQRLLEAGAGDLYIGRVRNASGRCKVPYCSGFCYWILNDAINILANSPLKGHEYEDQWVAESLDIAGIQPKHNPWLVIVQHTLSSLDTANVPRKTNKIIAAHLEVDLMQEADEIWRTGKQGRFPEVREGGVLVGDPKDPLSRVDILIKTFYRDGYLKNTVEAVLKHLPNARMIIVDDGPYRKEKNAMYTELRKSGHIVECMALDSGFSAKSNRGIRLATREFLLIAADDFDFTGTPLGLSPRTGIMRMIDVLDDDAYVDIASGRVKNDPYEGWLIDLGGGTWMETAIDYQHPRQTRRGTKYHRCHLTVNYSLIRTSKLGWGTGRVNWGNNEDIKIGGGEHGAFFIQALRAGLGVAYVEDVSINEQPFDRNLMDPRYPEFRGRARLDKDRKAFKRIGVDRYITFGNNTEIC